MFIHFTGVGAIPLTLSGFKDDFVYSAIPVEEEDYESICKAIDEFEEYLKKELFSTRSCKIGDLVCPGRRFLADQHIKRGQTAQAVRPA